MHELQMLKGGSFVQSTVRISLRENDPTSAPTDLEKKRQTDFTRKCRSAVFHIAKQHGCPKAEVRQSAASVSVRYATYNFSTDMRRSALAHGLKPMLPAKT
jgi:hypothetical protein